MMKKGFLTAISLATGLAFCQTAAASDEWTYEFTPYLYMAGIEGDIGVGGLGPVGVDASFDDILDNLDAGFMGMFAARKGPWTLAFDGSYMKLEADGPGGLTTVTNEMTIMQGAVGYRVMEDQGTSVDLLGALRYTKLELDLSGLLNGSGSKDWFDGVVGMHATIPVSDSVDLKAYADVGAGGSDLTYQFMLGLNWQFKEGYTAKFGYRYLAIDYEDDDLVFDVAFSGPYLGLGIAF